MQVVKNVFLPLDEILPDEVSFSTLMLQRNCFAYIQDTIPLNPKNYFHRVYSGAFLCNLLFGLSADEP